MKVSIRLKIILMGIILSILAMSVALIASYFTSKEAMSKQLDKSAENSMLDILDTFYDDQFSANYVNAISDSVEYVKGIYESDDTLPEFDTPEAEKEYLSKKYPHIYVLYPDVQIFIMYPALVDFVNAYKSLISVLKTANVLSGADTCYIAFYDESKERLIYVVDFCFGNNDSLKIERFPGSFASNMKKPSGALKQIETYSDGDVITKSLALYDMASETKTDPIAYVFLEYDYDKPEADAKHSTLLNFATLASASVLLIVLYALVSHFMIIRNLKKLSNSAEAFTRSLNSGEDIKSIDPYIKSKDEIQNLSTSFVSMEEEIINYIGVIKTETETKERMNAELNVASRIQIEALPSTKYDDKDISIRSFIKSAKEVGGDFYDYFYLDETHLAFVISDVTGKGIPASLFMMRAKELIKSKLLANNDIENVCFEVNNSLLKNNAEALFVTSFIGILDTKKEELTFVNAGHERPFIIKDGKVEQLQCNSNFVLGGMDDFKYKKEKIPFKKGETIFLHTDGLNESINRDREEFGYERILKSLDEAKDLSLDEMIKLMNDNLAKHCGEEEQFDDETLLFVKFGEKEINEKYIKPSFEVIEDVTQKFNNVFSFLSAKTKSEMGIIFDELLNNVVSYEKAEELTLEVNIKLIKEDIILIISSNGVEYNPFLREDNYIAEYSDDLKIGGFGLTIVKNLSSSIDYKRKDDKNILTITKKYN